MRRYLLIVTLMLVVSALQPTGAGATFGGENGTIALPNYESFFLQDPDRSFDGSPFCTHCLSPAFSPDGAKLAYQQLPIFDPATGGFTPGGIRVTDLSTGVVTVVSTENEAPYSWTSDGERIFLRGPGIRTLDADGSGRLTQILSYGTSPVMSPDGSQIAFNCNSYPYSDTSPGGICLMNADGSNVTALSGAGTTAQDPDWSPKGNKIVFSAGGSSIYDGSVYLINRSGKGIKRLLPFHDIFWPVWSPDSKQIVFVGNPVRGEAPCFAIQGYCYFVVDSNGANLKVIGGAEYIGRPSWQPLPSKADS